MEKATQTVEQFFEAWKQKEFKAMYELTQLTWRQQIKESLRLQLATDFPSVAKKLRRKPKLIEEQINKLKGILPGHLEEYSVKSVRGATEAMYDATVSVTYVKQVKVKQGKKTAVRDSKVTRIVTPRIIGEIEPYKPSENGKFGVNPISFIRGLY